jgi:hypothetical protein
VDAVADACPGWVDSRSATITRACGKGDGNGCEDAGGNDDSKLVDAIKTALPLDMEALAPEMMELLMSQLIADPGCPTCTEILPLIDLGRAGDTTNHSEKYVCIVSLFPFLHSLALGPHRHG